MNVRSTIWVLVIVVISQATQVYGGRLSYKVTPKNLSKQDVQIIVGVESRSEQMLAFSVLVEQPFADCATGELEIRGSSEILARTQVKPDRSEKGVTYTFAVLRSIVTGTVFNFDNFDCEGGPGDRYAVQLGEFVSEDV